MMRASAPSIVTITALLLAGWAGAASIHVDFGNDGVLAGNTDTDGNFWNVVDNGDSSVIDQALLDTTGANSGATISYEIISGGGFGNFSGPVGPDPFDQTAITTDSIFNNSTATHPITFKNLAANTQYSISMISRHGSGGTAVNGLITLLTGTSTEIGSGLTLVVNGDVLTYQVTSNSSGTIALGIARLGGGGTRLSAMTIEAIPEPRFAGFIVVFGLMFLLRRERS